MKETFGQRLRRLRLERRWSQQELSLRSGISTPHISSLERGKRQPSLEYARRLANALGVALEVLCDEDTEFQPPRMLHSMEDLPPHLQSFILKEESLIYLEAARRLSTLPTAEAQFALTMVDMLTERHRRGWTPESSITPPEPPSN